jgi:hypothetical protein
MPLEENDDDAIPLFSLTTYMNDYCNLKLVS